MVAGSRGWVNTYFGCDAQFNGVLGIWGGIDSYLQNVDQALCSPNCPCLFTNSTGYLSNTTITPVYNLWDKTTNGPGAVAFQNCSAQLQNAAFANAVREDPYFNSDNSFNPAYFQDYMSRIESQFQCTGWCNVTYYNTNYQTNVALFKYLFTDINNGPPKYIGCLNQLVDWLPGYLNAYASMTTLVFAFQVYILF